LRFLRGDSAWGRSHGVSVNALRVIRARVPSRSEFANTP
jgi:hypothetical protein